MIQVATYSGKEDKYNMEGIEQYSLHDIRSLDEYEITIIDLSSPYLWIYNGEDCYSINKINDFESISEMIEGSVTSKIVIILPQNVDYKYCWSYQNYEYKKEIKDMLDYLTCNILPHLYYPISECHLSYENTKTDIDGKSYDAAFYFKYVTDAIVKSNKSYKATMINIDKVILSTLKIETGNDLLSILKKLGIMKVQQEVPAWLDEIKMFDDEIQQGEIINCREKIENLQEKIKLSEEKLSENMRLKSALFVNGDELVSVVFSILEEMLGCDLSDFIDEKKEDFLVEIGDMGFIGEIKGVNHNVKNENISQLDVHYQSYLDEHEDKCKENIKALLIINHQKNKPISEREPVKDTQINLAKRNGSLIIETYTLLKMLEKYREGMITKKEIFLMIKEGEGILNV